MHPPERGRPAALDGLVEELRRDLRVPLPARTRILREVAADAEALLGELLGRGVPEDEAVARTRQLLLPNRSALGALRDLHGSFHERVGARFGGRAMRRWERAALALVASTAVAGAGAALAPAQVLRDPSPFLLPVLLAGAGGILLGLIRAYRLAFQPVGPAHTLRRGLAPVLGASAATGLLAAGGVAADLYRLAARMQAAPDAPGALVLAFVRADATLVCAGLTLALASFLLWFLLLQWIGVAEAAEHPFTPDPRGSR